MASDVDYVGVCLLVGLLVVLRILSCTMHSKKKGGDECEEG
jgi:hypothetical protein